MSFKTFIWTIMTGSRLKGELREGNDLLRQRKHIDALQYFRRIIKKFPDRPEGYAGMGQAYLGLGLRLEAKREDVIVNSLSLLKRRPDDLEVRLNLVSALLDKEMPGMAAAHAQYALKKNPHSPRLLRLAGRAYMGNRNYEKAVNVLRDASIQDPTNIDLLELYGSSLDLARRQGEAQKVYSTARILKAVEEDPRNPDAVGKAVEHFGRGGQKKIAMDLLEKALQAAPTEPLFWRLKGEMTCDGREKKECLISLHKAVQLNPLDFKAHRLLSQVYKNLGKPDHADKHRRLADGLEKDIRAGDAIATEVGMVRVLLDNHQDQAAMERAEALVRDHPQDWRGSYIEGIVFKHKALREEAVRAFRKAAAMNPRAIEPKIEAALVLSDLGMGREAITECKEASRLDPKNAEIRVTLARILREHGYFQEAMQEEEIVESLGGKVGGF